MIRSLAYLATIVLVAPLMVILYGAVFGMLYTPDQVLAAFILFIIGCLLSGAVSAYWEDLK